MTTGERLAAYLAGDMGADEQAAIAAELARDPSLRATLERLRQAEDLLGSLADPAPSATFQADLRAAVRAEAGDHARAVVVPATELARRRELRRHRFQRVGAGIAAAAAVVAAAVVVTRPPSSADSAATSTDAARSSAEEMAVDGDAGSAADMAAAAAMPEPVLANGGRYDRETFGALASNARLLETLAAAASDPSGLATQAGLLGLAVDPSGRAMGETTTAASAGSTSGEDAADATAAPGTASDDILADEPSSSSPLELALADAAEATIALANQCLPVLYTEGRELLPLWLEAATFDGEPALVAVLASRSPDGGFGRLELYAFGTSDCHIMFFQQFDT